MRFEVYEGGYMHLDTGQWIGADEWYWRLRARNGRIMADGGEGYASKSAARRAIHRIVGALLTLGHVPEIVEVES